MFAIRYEADAESDLRALRAFEARRILDEIEVQLSKTPIKPTKRRKLLEGMVPPWENAHPVWQLRVGDFRVFYDVDEARREVIVRAVRRKGTKSTEEIL